MRGKGGFRDEIPRSIPASRPDPLPALLTVCGQSKEEPVPWIPEGKGDLPLQWLQINGEKGELTFVQFTLQSEDGTEETWKYTPVEGCVQTEAKHRGQTSQLTLTTIQPLIQKLMETMPEDHLNGESIISPSRSTTRLSDPTWADTPSIWCILSLPGRSPNSTERNIPVRRIRAS